MREIKFRAWSKEDEKMRYHAERAANGHHQMNDIYHFYQLLDNPKYELMQYTGLKSKNGKEIYEGDIFKVEGEYDNGLYYEYSYEYEQVVWSDEWCGWCMASANGEVYDRLNEYELEELEIVGNIHENPELLEKI